MILLWLIVCIGHILPIIYTKLIYDFNAVSIDGDIIDFSTYKRSVLLIVNVASLCGFTDSHYRDLQRLQDILGFQNKFHVLAFPCNQFGEQEPLNDKEISEYIRNKYFVDFQLFSKINVTGPGAHPIFRFLSEQTSVTPDWNFYKYLVNHEGKSRNAWGPRTSISEIFNIIKKAIDEAILYDDNFSKNHNNNNILFNEKLSTFIDTKDEL